MPDRACDLGTDGETGPQPRRRFARAPSTGTIGDHEASIDHVARDLLAVACEIGTTHLAQQRANETGDRRVPAVGEGDGKGKVTCGEVGHHVVELGRVIGFHRCFFLSGGK